ncbi:MAG TPA: PqiC family protein [Burkholderiales bacterium]|nr:PqiC family protein [Burkholderiales bacterium]
MKWTAVAAAAMLLAGCASAPTPRFYTLSAQIESAPYAAGPSVSVAAVTVPDVVDRPQLVVAVNANEVLIVEQHRWAEPLKSELGRVIAENLSRITGNPRIAAYPQNASLNAEYRVLVDFQRLAGRPDGEVVLDALWSLRKPNGEVLRSGRARAQARGEPGYDALVAAYSRALAKISAEIAMALKGLPAETR